MRRLARARVARVRQKRIRTKPLKFRDSVIRKQAITGRRKRLGKDFRHRRDLGKRARNMGSWNVPVKKLATARAPTPDRRAAPEWPPRVYCVEKRSGEAGWGSPADIRCRCAIIPPSAR